MSEFTPPGFPAGGSAAAPSRARSRDRQPTKRSAAVTRWLFLGFAALLALLVVLILTTRNPVTYVVRANAPVQALQELMPENMVAVAVDPSLVEPNSFSGSTPDAALNLAEEFAAGKWLIYPIGEGQVVREENFSSLGEIAVPLAPNERLISVSAKAARAVAGAVRPGDRVDVFASESSGLTGMLGSNVEVVGVSIPPEQFDSVSAAQLEDPDISLSGSVPGQPIPGTYVLRVTIEDVAKYIAADTAGRLSIALRGKGSVTPEVLLPADLYEAVCTGNESASACQRTDANIIVPE